LGAYHNQAIFGVQYLQRIDNINISIAFFRIHSSLVVIFRGLEK